MATTDFTGGVTLSDAGWADDVDCSAYSVLSSVSGTNTIVGTGPATYSYSATRPPIWFIPAVTNTGAATINVTPSGASALGAKNIFFNGAALGGNELVASRPCALIYDGTQFHIAANSNLARQPTNGTEQATTSGTSIDFTGIPSWAKKITIMFLGVSTNGTSSLLIQLGDSGGVETSGYLGAGLQSGAVAVNFTAGIGVDVANAAAVLHGSIALTLEDASDFSWVGTYILARSDTGLIHHGAGSKSLSAALDRVRLTTVNGTDAFDAGVMNILYE